MEWKREMEENRRRRSRERVSHWAEEEEDEEDKDDREEEENKDSEEAKVSEEEGENEEGQKVEAWEEEMEVKEAEESEDEEGGENKVERGIKENDSGDEAVVEADERIDLKEEEKEKESEVEGKVKENEGEEKVVKEAQGLGQGEEDRENEVQWELMGNEEVVEEKKGEVREAKALREKEKGQNEIEIEGNLNEEGEEVEGKEVMEAEEMQEEQEDGQHEVDREVKDEKEENKVWQDEQDKEVDDGEKEHREQDQTGQYHLVEQFADQMRRTEDENIQEKPESKAQEDNTVKDSDSVESMSNEDSDSTGCEDTCYDSERIKDEERSVETQYLQNLDEQSWSIGNPILGAWALRERNEGEDSVKTNKETVAESWTTQEQEFQVDYKRLKEEDGESTDDEEAAEQSNDEDEDSKDEDMVKIYSKDHYPTDIFHTLIQFKDSSLLTDLTLSTNDGKSFHVHSPVLAAVSSLIWRILSGRNRRKDDDTSVGVHRWSVSLGPEVDHVGLEAIVEFAYTGIISCLNEDTMEQIRTAAETLGTPRVLMLCTEEEKSTKTGGQKKEEMISAAEQMMISLQSIKQLWMERVGCDVILEALGESLHGELSDNEFIYCM